MTMHDAPQRAVVKRRTRLVVWQINSADVLDDELAAGTLVFGGKPEYVPHRI
jgi:hypothetical protein